MPASRKAHTPSPVFPYLHMKTPIAIGSIVILAAITMISGCVNIGDDEAGLVSRKLFAEQLPSGRIIALNGEKGPQVDLLGPGLGWINPITYDVTPIAVHEVPAGQVGLITARDGKPLPTGRTYAPEWPSMDLLDARKFLTSEGAGFQGPQLTVLTPRKYRVNTALFQVNNVPALVVPPNQVVVIKDNTGNAFTGDAETINGVRLVPKGYSGIWASALTPDTYYLNTQALSPIAVKTSVRNYTYQRTDKYDDSIHVRSSDGFLMGVEVRVAVVVTPENAPRIVALYGKPDDVLKNAQEDDDLEVLEAQGVLPIIRAEVRNIGEKITALEMVNQRAEKEKVLQELVAHRLEQNYLKVVGLYLANVDLTITDAGKALLATQTDKEIATKSIETFKQQQAAQDQRKTLVAAQTTADMEKTLTEARISKEVNEERGKAQLKLAEYEAQAYQKIVEALGIENAARLEMIRRAGESNVVITPQVFLGNDPGAALAGALLAPKK